MAFFKFFSRWGDIFLGLASLGLTGCAASRAPELTLVSPVDGAMVRLMRPDWLEAMKSRLVTINASNDEYEDDKAVPCPAVLCWKNPLQAHVSVEVSIDKAFTKTAKVLDAGIGESAEIYNLETGRTYYWHLKCVSTGKIVSATGMFQTSDADPRCIYVPGEKPVPFNLRDIGGKHLAGGGRTKQSMAYRGTALDLDYTITDAGRKVLCEELNIRTDLDLRYPEQVGSRTASELGASVRWIHVPVNAYNSFTPEQNRYFRDAIRVFANPDNYPIYFHCAGGVDRTGEIAFLIEALLGVETEELFIDYELSALSIFPRSRDIPYFVQWRGKIAGFGKPEDSWQVKVEKYMLAIGVTPEEIAAIRANLIEK